MEVRNVQLETEFCEKTGLLKGERKLHKNMAIWQVLHTHHHLGLTVQCLAAKCLKRKVKLKSAQDTRG